MADKKSCTHCGHSEYTIKNVEYVYRHQGQYMVFQNVPAEVCLHCGARYYEASVILAIEERFFAILNKRQKPQNTVNVPIEAFAFA